MRQLDKNKVRHLSKFSQLILLDEEANIVSSCNSIFPTEVLQDIPVIKRFPFLESIFDYLFQLTPQNSEVKFSKIETPIDQLPGIYDFTFSKVKIDGKELLLWTIYDYTDLYEDFKYYQQHKNELEILRETLERRYKNLNSKEDINFEQNIILENFNHFQLNYFNKLKSALLSPVNALDGFTYVLANSFQKEQNNYLRALKEAVFDIRQYIESLQSLRPSVTCQQQPFSDKENRMNPKETVKKVAQLVSEQLKLPVGIDTEILPGIPDSVIGNELLLSQILYGLFSNILHFHPNSRIKITLEPLSDSNDKASIRFRVIEFLGRKNIILTQKENDALILRLSVIKQLIDLHKGSISVDRDPKSLGITVTFNLDYPI